MVPPSLPRPIISCCGSVTENIGVFVEHKLKVLGYKHESFIKDTPDFIRKVEEINKEIDLPSNTILVTMDISSLYTNISHDDGIECAREALDERDDKQIPTEYIVRLLHVLLEYNIFEFNKEIYQQMIGTAMGSKPAPPYANIFLAKSIDKQIWQIADNLSINNCTMLFMKRFLDDLFFIYTGTTSLLHTLLEEINNIHPNMKFVMQHTTPLTEHYDDRCNCEQKSSVPFLDTSCSIKDGKIVSDLFRKPTDRNKYLLPDSSHPNSCKDNIPFSLALRITRICSEVPTREMRYVELKNMLLERNYREGMINSAISKARAIPRDIALNEVVRDNTLRRPTCVVSWDPRLPSFPAIISRHWRSMTTSDPYLGKVFPEPPVIAYKRPQNIRDLLIRAKLPEPYNCRPRRRISGMKKCDNQCHACPYILEVNKVTSHENFSWKINKQFTCNTSNIVYMIICNKQNCNQQYIGESKRKLKERFGEHKGYIRSSNKSQPTGAHFSLPGHSIDNMNILILEKVKVNDTLYRKEREQYLIRKFNTFYNGMNKKP